MSRCTKLGDLENKEWFVALNWETQHTNCTKRRDSLEGQWLASLLISYNVTFPASRQFARDARVIANAADPFDTPRQVVVRELIYCIKRVPQPQIITDRLSPFANNLRLYTWKSFRNSAGTMTWIRNVSSSPTTFHCSKAGFWKTIGVRDPRRT